MKPFTSMDKKKLIFGSNQIYEIFTQAWGRHK